MERPITIVTSGTPWWATLLIALGGAAVGGSLTLLGGVLSDRRSRLADRQRRIEELTYRFVTSTTHILTIFVVARTQSAYGKDVFDLFRTAANAGPNLRRRLLTACA